MTTEITYADHLKGRVYHTEEFAIGPMIAQAIADGFPTVSVPTKTLPTGALSYFLVRRLQEIVKVETFVEMRGAGICHYDRAALHPTYYCPSCGRHTGHSKTCPRATVTPDA